MGVQKWIDLQLHPRDISRRIKELEKRLEPSGIAPHDPDAESVWPLILPGNDSERSHRASRSCLTILSLAPQWSGSRGD